MDKKTLIAVVLSVVVISIGFMLQGVLFPQPELTEQQMVEQQQAPEPAAPVETQQTVTPAEVTPAEGTTPTTEKTSSIRPSDEELSEQIIKVDTDLFQIKFSTRGAVITSIVLNEHLDNDNPLEMINAGESELSAFNIYFGSTNEAPVNAVFNYTRLSNYKYEFSKTFFAPGADGEEIPFILRKTYTFQPADYLFELRVSIENSLNEYLPLNYNGYAYTLGFGPQIGPAFEKLDGRYEYRRYQTYADGKLTKHKVKDGFETITSRVNWAAVSGKYFSVIVVPDATSYGISFSTLPLDDIISASQMYLSRPEIKSSRNEDVYRFYIGPKTEKDLTSYNDPEKNGFGLQELKLEKVIEGNAILGWLEWILKKVLIFFYSIIPNYGIAIILLTILIKIVLFPITHKSYESTSKMQALNPKITEIKAKYKDNPNKMNAEMAALYKTEKVSPLGGCLPMLLQMPVFFALYGLLSKHFDLRGAPFIGWINDLSSPDSILNVLPAKLPILGWSDIRLLPILFVGTQLLSSKLMQSPNQTAGGNMKMMTYLMPVMFFFILYDAPSGLLLYWTVTNILTAAQQKFISIQAKKKKELE